MWILYVQYACSFGVELVMVRVPSDVSEMLFDFLGSPFHFIAFHY